jgi:hypothetical protein
MQVAVPTLALAILAMIGTAPLAAGAQTAAAIVASAPSKVRASGTLRMTATVLSIDTHNQNVLLMDAQGKLLNLNVNERTKNRHLVRVGDKLTAEYTEGISLQLKKRDSAGGSPPIKEAAMGRPPKGAKLAHAVGLKTAVATVVALDTQKQSITLRGPQGNEYDLQVPDPTQFTAVSEGDEVDVVYAEALVIAVHSTPNSG